jgi:hypothetical protein
MVEDIAANQWQVIARAQPLRFLPNPIASSQSPYSIKGSDLYLPVSAGASAGTTVNLPPATGNGQVLVIEKVDANNQPVTLAPNAGDTIDGASSWLLVGQYESVMLADAAAGQWSIVAGYGVSQRMLLPKVLTHAQAIPYAVLPTDVFLVVGGGPSTSASQILLPPAVGSGRTLVITDYGLVGGTGLVVGLTPASGDLINGSVGPLSLTVQFAGVGIVDGSPGNWFVWSRV